MNRSRGIESGNWRYQVVESVVYITAQDPTGSQVALTASEAYDLLEYLFQHKEELYKAAHKDLEQKIDPSV